MKTFFQCIGVACLAALMIALLVVIIALGGQPGPIFDSDDRRR